MISRKRMFSGGSNSSAAIIGGNDDLLTEILVLLPVRSVVRLKLVSKRWSVLISGEHFTRLHVQNHSRRRAESQHSFILGDAQDRSQILMCDPTINKLVPITLPQSITSFDRLMVMQSMNGLLLLGSHSGTEYPSFFVFNPITKQCRSIDLYGYKPFNVCMISDTSKLDHYKLLMINDPDPILARFSVYDSSTQRWTHGIDPPFAGEALGFRRTPALEHHLVTTSLRLHCTDYTNRNLFRYPEAEEGYHGDIYESNEYLNVFQLKYLEEEKRHCFRVGEMIDDEWVICREVTLDFGCSMVKLLGMIREEKLDDSKFLFQVPGQLVMCRFSGDQQCLLEVLVDFRCNSIYVENQFQFINALPFIPTFAPV